MKPFIKIHPADTVAVALSPLKEGTEIQIDDQTVVLTEDIPQGHKFALTNITEGDSIIKYGNSIGVAKTDITKGSWIHTHNMKTGLGDLLTYTYNKENGNFLKKNDFYCFKSGSCFKNRFDGNIFDVSCNGAHAVYRYAKPIFISL